MSIYSIEEKKAFKECSLLRFETPDEKWLDFVSANRQGNYQGKHYDLIYGAVANDDVYRTITLYMTGILSREQALTALKIRKLFDQMVFATEKSLKYLHLYPILRFYNLHYNSTASNNKVNFCPFTYQCV